MADQRRESFFVCENRWFDGDRSGDREFLAVKLGNLTPHEIFEVFETAVNRRVAKFHADYGFDDEDITFRNRETYLQEFQKEMSESFEKFLYSDSLGVDASSQIIILEHLDILIKAHIKTYPVPSSDIDFLFESRIIPFVSNREVLYRHIHQRQGGGLPIPEDENENNHDQLNRSLESFVSRRQIIEECLDAIKNSLLQKKIQLPFLEFLHYGGGGAYSATSYKIECQGLGQGQPEPNWIELQLKDRAFRSIYPAIHKKLLNGQYEAISDNDILAKALSAVELLTISQPLMPNPTNAAFMPIIQYIRNRYRLCVLLIKKIKTKHIMAITGIIALFGGTTFIVVPPELLQQKEVPQVKNERNAAFPFKITNVEYYSAQVHRNHQSGLLSTNQDFLNPLLKKSPLGVEDNEFFESIITPLDLHEEVLKRRYDPGLDDFPILWGQIQFAIHKHAVFEEVVLQVRVIVDKFEPLSEKINDAASTSPPPEIQTVGFKIQNEEKEHPWQFFPSYSVLPKEGRLSLGETINIRLVNDDAVPLSIRIDSDETGWYRLQIQIIAAAKKVGSNSFHEHEPYILLPKKEGMWFVFYD